MYLIFKKGICMNVAPKNPFSFSGYQTIINDEILMQTVLAKIGPIIVSLNSELLLNYTDGIINSSTCSYKINHNALAVGYNKTGNYYIVKNRYLYF